MWSPNKPRPHFKIKAQTIYELFVIVSDKTGFYNCILSMWYSLVLCILPEVTDMLMYDVRSQLEGPKLNITLHF